MEIVVGEVGLNTTMINTHSRPRACLDACLLVVNISNAKFGSKIVEALHIILKTNRQRDTEVYFHVSGKYNSLVLFQDLLFGCLAIKY